VRRCHSITGLRPEKAEEYFNLHSSVWPEVLRTIELANIRNYSIAVKEIEGKLYLFSYYEYVGTDLEADMRKIAENPETQRWWRETDPCQLPLPDAAARDAIWADAREVFYTP
jgi:L-rhamnose mutarotase